MQSTKFKKKRVEPELPVLTQEELLAEAAVTEIENTKSLEVRSLPPALPSFLLFCKQTVALFRASD